MGNRLNFTEEMKEIFRSWKGGKLFSFVADNENNFITKVRFIVNNRAYELNNGYVLYEYDDGDNSELTCFSCTETDISAPFAPIEINGKCKETVVGETIKDVYIVKDFQKRKYVKTGDAYDFSFDTALLIETEKCCYAFYRHILFETVDIVTDKDVESVLKKIKSAEEIYNDLQMEDDIPAQVERRVEKL